MKKFIVFTASTVGAIAVLMAMFGGGVAAADGYAGQTYADASSALTKASLKGVIAGRVGSTLPDPQCVVTRSEKAHWVHVSAKKFANIKDTVLLFLNCNATVATVTTAGNSAASPEGRAAMAAASSPPAPPASTAAASPSFAPKKK
jgi:hypothetical protein